MSVENLRPGAQDILLIVDVQHDFCPGGGLAVPDGDAVVPVINRLAGGFDHVVLTQDWHPADHRSFASNHSGAAPFSQIEMPYGLQTLWPDHCIQKTAGADLHEDLDVGHAEMIIRKGFRRDIDSYSAFFENDQKTPTGLGGYLRERGFERVYLVGLATDFCVRFSAVDARRLDFEAVMIESGCRAIDMEGSLAAARTAMEECGVRILDDARID